MTNLVDKDTLITITVKRENGASRIGFALTGVYGDAATLRLLNNKVQEIIANENLEPYRADYDEPLEADAGNPDGETFPSLMSAATTPLTFSDRHLTIEVFFDALTASRIEAALGDPEYKAEAVTNEFIVNSTFTFIVSAYSEEGAKQVVNDCLTELSDILSINRVSEWTDPVVVNN